MGKKEEEKPQSEPIPFRCLKDLVDAIENGKEVDEALYRSVEWEEELIRQAIETPHALLTTKTPPPYFEVKDYRIAWKVMRELLPSIKPGERISEGHLLGALAREEPIYFGSQFGRFWLDPIMSGEPCGIPYAIGELLPTLHARFEMKHWKKRTEEFISRVDTTKDPQTLQTEWRLEAYAMSLTHDGGLVGKLISDAIGELDMSDKTNRNIVRLGIPEIDRFNGGGHGRGEMMVVGGGTSHGKSYFAQRLMRLQAALKQRALYISVEDSDELVVARFVADLSLSIGDKDRGVIAPHTIRDRTANESMVDEVKQIARDELSDYLYFFDAKKWTCSRICDLIRRHRYLCGIDLVIIDYLQAIQPDESSNNRTADTGAIVAKLKSCCHEAGVALVLLSQYARDEYRNGAIPTITSCKYAGEIENESEIMLLLWRDDDNILHAKVAKLKWSKAAGRKYIISTSEHTGCFMGWEDDFSENEDQSKQKRGPQRRSYGQQGGTI